jgi:DNA repair photolyase
MLLYDGKFSANGKTYESIRITRQYLEVLVEYPPAVVMIRTRSPLITRDCDLFHELRERGVQVVVGVTLSTDREEVRKIFEPWCASIPRRLATLTDLHARSFLTQASLSPLLPCQSWPRWSHPTAIG